MSKNRTEGNDSPNRPDRAIDIDAIVETTEDAIRVHRPDWMTEQQWSTVAKQTTAWFDQLAEDARANNVRRSVAEAPDRGCTEFDWCVLGKSEDHLLYHA